MTGCGACEIVEGRSEPAGGVVLRTGAFTVHGLAAGTPIRGWLVVTSNRHVRGVYDLSDAEWVELGPLIAKLMRLQKSELGAEHAYLFAIGDQLHHAHFHLVPRFADTPERLRARGAFDHRPEDILAPSEVRAALDRIRLALSEG